MLGRTNSLLFPRLIHVGKINDFKGNKTAHLYKLDWSGMESILKKRHEEWVQARKKDRNKPLGAALRPTYSFFPALSVNVRRILDHSQFAITESYRREIIRNAKKAVEERDIERGFDTCIRDMCQQTVEAHVEVAFKLLADCLCDDHARDFSRDYVQKFMMPRWMLYRFWFHQTGWGLVWNRSGMNELEENLKDWEWCGRVGYDAVDQYKAFLWDMQKNQDEYKKHIDWPDCNAEDENPIKDVRQLPQDGTIHNLIAAFTNLYQSSPNVLSFNVMYLNKNMPFEIPKHVNDFGYTVSGRRSVVDVITEGTSVSIRPFEIYKKSDMKIINSLSTTVANFLEGNSDMPKKAYKLNLLIDESNLRVGVALTDF